MKKKKNTVDVIRQIAREQRKPDKQRDKDIAIMRQINYGITMCIFRGADANLGPIGKLQSNKTFFARYLKKTLTNKIKWLNKKLFLK